MPFLATTLGELSYNGVTFDSSVLSSLRNRPVPDASGRTTKWVEITIRCKAYIQSVAGTNATIEDMMKKLTAHGGKLKYVNRGIGASFTVNDSTGPKDVNWGPVPKVFDIQPLGAGNAMAVDFEVTTCIPLCDAAKYQFAYVEFVYAQDIEVDEDGYTKHTVTGSVTIPQTRVTQGTRTLTDHVDRYKEPIFNFFGAPPLGFKLVGRDWHIHENKNKADFRVVYEEIPYPLPGYCTRAEVEENVESSLAQGFVTWQYSLSGSLTVTRGVPKAMVFPRILQIIEDRVNRIRATQGVELLLLEQCSFGNEVFGRSSYFSVRIRIVKPKSLQTIVADTGMYAPIAGTDYFLWRTSLLPYALHPRGAAKLTFGPTADVIIDLCQQATVNAPGQASITTPQTGLPKWQRPQEPVPPNGGYIKYENKLKYNEDPKPVKHKPLAPDGRDKRQIAVPGPNPVTDDPGRIGYVPGGVTPGSSSGGTKDIIQKPTTADGKITLEGRAARLGYRPAVPAIKEINGVKVTESHRDIEETTIGAVMGMPLFAVRWAITYIVPEIPRGPLPFVSGPIMGTGGGTGSAGNTRPQ